MPLRDGDHAAVNATPESALRKRRLNALGAASLVAEVALVGVNAALNQESFPPPAGAPPAAPALATAEGALGGFFLGPVVVGMT